MKNNRVILSTAVALATFAATAYAEGDTLYMSRTTPFSDTTRVATAIQDECQLPQQTAELIEEIAKSEGITIVRDDEAAKAGKGRVLEVAITDAVSSGNAFIGHRKQVAVKGRLLADGTEIGNFHGVRSSGGGAFAGFKGSCSVLGRCSKTLAKDIVRWLKEPGKDSRIGE